MLRTTVCALACALASSLTGSAQAAYINFSFFGSTLAGSGSVNLTANGDGTYTATSGTLLVFGDPSLNQANLVANPNGTAVAFAPGVETQGNYDDQILPLSTGIDANGLYFQNGSNAVFLRYVPTTGQYQYTDYNTATSTAFTQSLPSFNFTPVMGAPASVPTPASWALMGMGCGGLLPFALRRAQRRLTLAA